MIEHYMDGRRVYTVGEAAEHLGEKKDTVRQRLHRAGTEPADWINPREPVYYPEDLGLEDHVVSFAQLAADLDTDAERLAQFAGALTPHDPRTGRVPEPWTGKGIDYVMTHGEADRLSAIWAQAASTTKDFTDLIDGTEPIERMPNTPSSRGF